MLTIGYAQSFGQFSTPSADAVRALQAAVNQLIADPLSRVTVNGQLTSETTAQIPIVARKAMDFMFENGLAVPPVLNRAAAGQLTAEALAFDADTLIALTNALASGARGTAPSQPTQDESILDKLKAFFTTSGPSTPVPQPPSVACAQGQNIDPQTGAALDTSGVCVCPFGTVWDDTSNRCVSTISDTVVQEALVEVQRDSDVTTKVAPAVLRDPAVARDATIAANNAVVRAKAAGKSVPEQKVAAKEAAKKVVLDAASKKKFFRVDNPVMWVAIGGGVAGVVIIGALVRSAAAAKAAPAAAALPAAATAVGWRRRRSDLGLSPQEHAEESRGWYRSASSILKVADRVSKRNRCGSIEHYTDAIAEGTVATVQGEQAMEDDLVQQARQLVRRATRSQRTAVQLCRRS